MPPPPDFRSLALEKPVTFTFRDKRSTVKIDITPPINEVKSIVGRAYLRQKYLHPERTEDYKNISLDTHEFLMRRIRTLGAELFIHIPGLRWSSGGYLPIVKWKGRRWVACFFRDLFPIGWNLPLGGSRDSSERIEIDALLHREFLEELIVCWGEPRRGSAVEQRPLLMGTARTMRSVQETWHVHQQLRRYRDGISWTINPERAIRVREPSTPISVVIESKDGGDTNHNPQFDNVLISINPFELGIEIIKICEFQLDKGDYLLDGEIWYPPLTGDGCLVRQPVGLFDLEYLRKTFVSHKSLGTHIWDQASMNAKDIGSIPPDRFHIFHADIDMRKSRLEMAVPETPESDRLKTWLKMFAQQFAGIRNGDDLSPPLSYFAAPTWKSLELAFQHRLV